MMCPNCESQSSRRLMRDGKSIWQCNDCKARFTVREAADAWDAYLGYR